ncbi:MAG: hypothetical protein AAFZ15_23265 [Bacteroidota bacterium]
MKTNQFILTALVILLFGLPSYAQTEKDKSIGFGGPSFINTTFAGDWAFEAGGLGGGFATKNIYIGGGGFGLEVKKNNYNYTMGYGGLMLGHLWGGNEKTAINFYVLGGYGGASEDGKDIEKEGDDFWVVRPAAEIDFLITNWMRIGVGGGYRWVTGSNLITVDDGDLSAPFGSITFRFGNWR